jgi:hypothetical protein
VLDFRPDSETSNTQPERLIIDASLKGLRLDASAQFAYSGFGQDTHDLRCVAFLPRGVVGSTLAIDGRKRPKEHLE